MVNGPTKEMEKAYHFAKEMTEDEYNIYAYYLGKGDTGSAKKYLDSIEQSITYRFAENFYEQNLKDANIFEQIIFGLSVGTEQFQTGLENLISDETEYDSSYRQLISGKVQEDLKDSTFGKVAYDLSVTTGNMLPSILASTAIGLINPVAGNTVGTALMGASAKGNAYAEMINLGYTKEQASNYSTLVGASEAGLQYLLGGIGKLGGSVSSKAISSAVSKIDNVFARTAIQLGGSMLSEGAEEYLQEVLDPFFKNIAFGEDNDIRFISEEALYSGLLGALSAGVLEGGSTVGGNVSTYRKGKQIKAAGVTAEQLSELGRKLSVDSEAYKLAGRINEETGAYTIGRMFNELNTEITAQNKAEIKEALRAKGINPVSANSIANWMERVVAGEELTSKQKAALENNPVLGEVMRDVLYERNTTALQRQAGLDSIRSQLEEYQIKQALDKAVKKAEKKKAKNTANNTADTQDVQNTAQQAEMEDFEKEADTSLAESEKANEANLRVSDNGRTFSTKTGEDLDIVGIASTKDKTFKTADGQTVDSKDVSFATENEAVLFDSVLSMDLPTEIANAIIDGYIPSDNISVTDYLLGSNLAYRYGYAGAKDIELMLDSDVRNIPEHLSKGLYNLGRETAKAEISKEQAEIDSKKAQKSENKAKKKGRVTFDGKELSKEFEDSLTDIQRESIKGIKVIAEVLGNDVNLFASYEAKEGPYKGKRVYKDSNGNVKLAPNGFYNPDGSINLDINSGNLGEGTMLYTLSHELTHHIRKWSPAKFKVLADFVVEQYSDNGIKINDLVYEQMAKAKKNGKSISYGTAYEEVIADACSTMLLDSNAIEKLAQKDKTLFEKIKSFIKDFIDKINKLYKNFSPDAKEAQYVKDIKGMTDKLQALWFEGLEDAGETYGKIEAESLNHTELKYELRKDESGKTFVSVDENAIDLNNGRSIAENINLILKKFNNIIDVKGQKIRINKMTNDEWRAGSAARQLLKTDRQAYNDKIKAIANADDILKAANKWVGEMVKHTRKDSIVEFARGNVRYKVANNGYIADVLVAIKKDGSAVLYELVNIVPTKITEPSSYQGKKSPRRHDSSVTKETIPQNSESSQGKFSDRDSAVHNKKGIGVGEQKMSVREFDWNSEGGQLIASTMSMETCKQMIERAYRIVNPNQYEETPIYRNADQWLADVGADEVALYIENEYMLQEKYLDKIPAYLDGDVYVSEIIEAYQAGVLKGSNNKEEAKRLNVSEGIDYTDGRFYAPQKIEGVKELYETANQKLTKVNKKEVTEARAKILLFAHNRGAVEKLGITQSELNKKLRSWANYSAKARDISARVNNNVAISNMWTGIENSSYLYNATVSEDDFLNLVGDISGSSSEYERRFIASTMLALDTHIDYTGIKFKFGENNFERGSVLGDYNDSSRTIRIRRGSGLNTVSHEMGHAIDHQWERDVWEWSGRESRSSNNGLSLGYINLSLITDPEVNQWIKNFQVFVDNISDSSSITSQYAQSKNEVFARFVAWFTEQTMQIATGRMQNYGHYIAARADKFTYNHYIEFVKILQEKAKLDAKHQKANQEEVKSSGLSYVTFSYEQVKNIDNKTPTSDPDIRFSDRDSVDSLLERRTSIQSKVNELRKTRKELESSDEYNNLISDILSAETETEKTKSINKYNSWMAKTKYDEIVDEIESLQKEYSEINRIISERVKQKAIEDERKKIAESGLSAADYFRKSAIKEFGYTPYFYDAGYMLPNGKLLNFSGEKGKHFGSRGQDHRAIETVYADVSRGKAMLKFMSEGNIRVMAETPGLDISSVAEPTSEQYTVIKKFVREYAKEKYLAVDITDENGNVIGTYGYENNINADRVVNDIKYYFQNGAIREQSSVSKFFYSDRDPDSFEARQEVQKQLVKENAILKEDNILLKELVALQRKVTNGTILKKSSVDAVSKKIMKQLNVKGNTQELSKLLSDVYSYILRGTEVTWEDITEKAQPAINWIYENMQTEKVVDEYTLGVLREIRKSRVSLDETQKAEIKAVLGSYKDFQKYTLGKIIIAKDGLSMDSWWGEMNEKYPNIFDSDISSSDMPTALIGILDNLSNSLYEEVYNYQSEMTKQDVLTEIYDGYWDVSTLHTVADQNQKKINELKAKHKEKMSKVRSSHNKKIVELKNKHKQEIKEIKAALREKSLQKEKDIRTKYQESRQKSVEGREKTLMKSKIRKVVSHLNTLLLNPTKEKHVPVQYQKAVAQMLEILNNDEELRIARTEKRLTNAEKKYLPLIEAEKAKDNPDFELIEFYQSKIQSNKDSITRISDNIKLLKDAYHEITTSDNPIYVNSPEIEELLDGYRSFIGEKTSLSQMTLQQLDYVYNAYKIVEHMISEANKGHKLNRSKTISEYSEEAVREIREAHEIKTRLLSSVKIGKSEIKVPHMYSSFKWEFEKPWFAFRKIGSKTMNELYDNLRKGEDIWAVDTQNAAKKFEDLAQKYNIKEWKFDKKIKCGDAEITLDQLLALYAYSKREAADKHLAEGGFVFDSSVKLRKGKKGILEYQITMPKPQKVSKMDMIELMSNLTDDMKAWADEMQDYLSNDLSAIGNEVSRELYGINLFNEKHYFPIKVMQEVLDFNAEKHTDIVSNITNMGMTKPVLPNANNTIVLGGFTDIWARHCNDMAKYHAFALAIDDFTKVYNFGKGAQSFNKSMKVAIKNAKGLGDEANKYIQTFLQDVNGGVRVDEMRGIDALISKFKKSSVLASVSVIIQQPSAIARAFGMINPMYFVKTDATIRHSKTVAEMEKYAPIAIIKRLGGFDTSTGGKTVDVILGRDNKGIINKGNNALGYLPQKADELTWCAIWKACKREAKHKYKLEGEALLKKAGERFTEVVQMTQVYDSVFSRNAMMRSKSKFNKMVTAFMAEPITSMNCIDYAWSQIRQGNIKTGVAMRAACLTAVVLNSLLSAVPYAWRDDDDDETFTEKYISSAVGETVEGLNPITYFPVIKDIYSLMQGYDVERTDMALVSDVIEKVGNLISAYSNREDEMTDEELAEAQDEINQAWIDAGFEILNMFGIPADNLRREIVGIVKTATRDNDYKTTWTTVMEAISEKVRDTLPFGRLADDESKSDKIYQAIADGDKEMLKRLKDSYSTDTAYENAVRKALRENDPRIKEAAEAGYNGDVAERVRIAKEIIAEGNFSQDIVVEAINVEVNAIRKELDSEKGEAEDVEEKKSIYSTKDIYMALEDGDATLAKEIIADIVSVKVENYMAKDEDLKQIEAEKKAKTSVKSSLSEYWKKLYVEAYNAKDADEMRRIRFALKDTGLYGTANDIISTCNNWVKESRKK